LDPRVGPEKVAGQIPYLRTRRRRKGLLLLFFRKEESSFSEEKEAKRLYLFAGR
jgi:hypothetical protein